MKYEHSDSSSQVLYSVREVFLNGFSMVSAQFRSYVTASLTIIVVKNHGVREKNPHLPHAWFLSSSFTAITKLQTNSTCPRMVSFSAFEQALRDI